MPSMAHPWQVMALLGLGATSAQLGALSEPARARGHAASAWDVLTCGSSACMAGALFDSFDHDASGAIDYRELARLLKAPPRIAVPPPAKPGRPAAGGGKAGNKAGAKGAADKAAAGGAVTPKASPKGAPKASPGRAPSPKRAPARGKAK